MSYETYTMARRARGYGGGSLDARARGLAAKHELEVLEEMAVAVVDTTRKQELELAIRIGREARGGSIDSGGAMHEPDDPRAAPHGRSTGGRIVLDGTVPPPPLGTPLDRPIGESGPEPARSRWQRLKGWLS